MCLFCDLAKHSIIENDLCYMLFDKFPQTPGHALIIPKRHIETVFEMNTEEWAAAGGLINLAKQEIEKEHQKINGELREENKKLKEKIKVYENPDDMTGIFENCTELNVNLSSTEEMKRDLYKEVIEEVREVINTYKYIENDDGMYEPILDGYDIQKLLQILDKVKGDNNDK